MTNLQLKKSQYFFWSKIAVYLSLGLHKGHQSYRRSLQPSKQNIQHFKTWNVFFLFLWAIFALLDPDSPSQCGSGSSRSKSLQIRNRKLPTKIFSPFKFSILSFTGTFLLFVITASSRLGSVSHLLVRCRIVESTICFSSVTGSAAVEHALPVVRAADNAGPTSSRLAPANQAHGEVHLQRQVPTSTTSTQSLSVREIIAVKKGRIQES